MQARSVDEALVELPQRNKMTLKRQTVPLSIRMMTSILLRRKKIQEGSFRVWKYVKVKSKVKSHKLAVALQ